MHHLCKLVNEKLVVRHILPTSPWNSPVFVIQKKSSKWRLLHDLHPAMENMGALQHGLPSSTMIPMNWHLTILDLKNCLFTIPLDPADALRFALSVPSTDVFEP